MVKVPNTFCLHMKVSNSAIFHSSPYIEIFPRRSLFCMPLITVFHLTCNAASVIRFSVIFSPCFFVYEYAPSFLLQRNLKIMVNMGLSAKQEKDSRVQLVKKEVAEMIKTRIPLMKSKVILSFLFHYE